MSALGLIAKLTTALLITQAEVPAPTAPTPASNQEADTAVEAAPEPAAPPAWQNNQWVLLKPELNLFELDGYFRLRPRMLRNLNFGLGSAVPVESLPPDLSRFSATDGGDADVSSTDIRLRLEPTIHISRNVEVTATFDVFDNYALGSSSATSNGEVLLDDGTIETQDAIHVKRAYASLKALNEQLEVTLGRVPNHFGLGMLFNSGDCLSCDYGHTADRLSFGLNMMDHLFVASYDWVAAGPSLSADYPGRLGFDAFPWDDVDQYSVKALRVDSEELIEDHVAQGKTVLNYGAWAIYRTQTSGTAESGSLSDDNADTLAEEVANGSTAKESRDGTLYVIDAFAKLYSGLLTVGIEGAFIGGSFNDNIGGENAPDSTTVTQLGLAAEINYGVDSRDRGAQLNLKFGGASGDSWPGMGTFSDSEAQRGLQQSTQNWDSSINNFQFSPDYHLDLLLFRRILGRVSDAWYVRPSVTYLFDNDFELGVASIYSQSFFKRSTPRCWAAEGESSCSEDRPGELGLGLEFDGQIAYQAKKRGVDGGIRLELNGGVLVPLGGFDLSTASETYDTSVAWTIEAQIGLLF